MTHRDDGDRAGEGGAAPRPLRTASDFDPEVLRLFDRYVHGLLDRRGFLEAAGKFALAVGLTTAGLLDALTPRFAQAQKVPPSDPRLVAEYVEIDSPRGYGKVRAYCVRPAKGPKKLPAVLVVHENRGLNPHIEDVARRVALEKYIAFAPDALFPLGGYPGDEDEARELFQKLDQQKTREDFVAAAQHLARHGNGKVGVVGFCYGGGIASFLATRLPELDAAVSFYGSAPPLEAVPGIKAALMIHLAEHDERINAAWPAYESALKNAGAAYAAFTYPGAQHGFNNDTTPRFDEAAAKLAWARTTQFFNRHLRGVGTAKTGKK
jgi:carboxymethylenebutenolidase